MTYTFDSQHKTTPARMFGSHIAHAIDGEATSTRMGLQELDVCIQHTSKDQLWLLQESRVA